MRRAAWRRRAARAIDEPISPAPMIASSSKIGSASGSPSRSITFASHKLGERGDDASVSLFATNSQTQGFWKPISRDCAKNESARAQKGVCVRGGPIGLLWKGQQQQIA